MTVLREVDPPLYAELRQSSEFAAYHERLCAQVIAALEARRNPPALIELIEAVAFDAFYHGHDRGYDVGYDVGYDDGGGDLLEVQP
jgi:hypothetical protein